MKCSIPEISWHNREPVLSVDLFPLETNFYRLATGGTDAFVLIWKLINENGSVNVEILSELSKHQRSVNVVKWSPNGQYLASGDDDATIIIWQLKSDNVPTLDEETDDQEKWIIYKILRGHKEDIYDLCWSPNSMKLLSGSVDNSAIIWDINKGRKDALITDHKSFVQGVTWDPKDQYFATLSSDRLCRVFDAHANKIKARIGRGTLPLQESHPLYNKHVKYFHDDTFKTFFRRLNFSPDGSFLVVPSGSVETEDCKNALHATYIFTLDSFKRPSAILPMGKQCSIVAKCCPLLFELQSEGHLPPYIDLPYRMVIAIATDSDVMLYDTQQLTPFAHLQNIHYTRLTDLTWSADGLMLVASSTDGYITLVTFDIGELGTIYVKEESEIEDNVLNISGCDALPDEEPSKIEITPPKEVIEIKSVKRPSFIEQWAAKGPISKKKHESHANEEIIEITVSPVKSDIANSSPTSDISLKTGSVNTEIKVPKRIKPTLISLFTNKPEKSTNKSGTLDNSKDTKKEIHQSIKPILTAAKLDSTPKEGFEGFSNEESGNLKLNKENKTDTSKLTLAAKQQQDFNVGQKSKRILSDTNNKNLVIDCVQMPGAENSENDRSTCNNASDDVNNLISAHNQAEKTKHSITKLGNDIPKINILTPKKVHKGLNAISKSSDETIAINKKHETTKGEENLTSKTILATSDKEHIEDEVVSIDNKNMKQKVVTRKNNEKALPKLQTLSSPEISVEENLKTSTDSMEKQHEKQKQLSAKKLTENNPGRSPKMSLLNFFKVESPSHKKDNTIKGEKVVDKDVKSTNDSDGIIIDCDETVKEKDHIKIKTSNLFKKTKKSKNCPDIMNDESLNDRPRNKIKKTGDIETIVIEDEIENDTLDNQKQLIKESTSVAISEDTVESLNLQIEEDICNDAKVNLMEIKPVKKDDVPEGIQDKNVELLKTEPQKRRIPFITLSSPKNKKTRIEN